jgi:opacity protein-like surface antigen
MKSLIAAAAILVALAAPALANDCPNQLKMAEDMLSKSTLDDAAKKKIQDHIDQAKAEHEAGKHDESLATLKDASQLLGM